MALNLNSEWNTYRALEADKIISNMFTVSDKSCCVSVANGNTAYNVTPEHVRAFYDAKERMEREVKEAELRKSQMQNKRLRAMVKKVIFSGDRTIIMWNDGTKTVTKCHNLDTYDPEKGILACMAKKLYENTNLFNEIIQEYVDFDFEKDTYDLAAHARQAYRIETKKLKEINAHLKHELDNEVLNREEMENIYYSLQSEYDAYVKQCSLYREDIKLLESRIASRDEQIKDLEEEIKALEEERNLLQDELDSATPYGNYY